MRIGNRAALAALLGSILLGASASAASAQGVTTGAVAGTVTDQQGQPVVSAQVTVVNRATGYTTSTLTRNNGFYFIQGLEVGGPYTVTISSLGFQEFRRDEIYVRLSATTRVDAQLTVQAVQLEALAISVARSGDFSPTRQGVSSVVSDTLLRRMPTLSRDFVDLVKLTPQVVSPASGAASAGGAYNRYNTFTIDGANQSERFNLGSAGGIPGGGAGGKVISAEAVKEFRVMMTPTDVRQGNFAGMLVNAVTKSGTNEFHGGAVFSHRNEAMAAEPLREPEYNVTQFGFHFGGPIIQDRLHFFIAPEWQRRSTPAGGPYYTASGGTSPDAPAVPLDSLQVIADIMQQQYGFDVGGVGPVDLETPLTNLFGRIDFAISPNHRLVLRQLINRAEDGSFFRNSNTLTPSANSQNSGFRFGSNMYSRVNRNNSTVLQLYSNFPSGISNELIVGYNTIEDIRDVPVAAPEISVGVGDPARAVTFGTEQFSPGNLLEQDIFEIVNNVTIPFGDHTVTVGGRLDHTHIFNNFAQRSFGVYVFPTIEALRNGEPSSYSIGYDNSGTGRGVPADFRVQMYSLYAQDQWTVNDRLTLTYGLRADIPRFLDRPLQNDSLTIALDSAGLNGLRTGDAVPKTQVLWSPRFGFNYDPTGDQQNQVRGNIGIFTGPPPYILLGNAFANTGLGLVTLNCDGSDTPAFTLDVSQLPRACAGQAPPAPGQASTAGVNTTDPNFKYPQYLGASLGFDRQLPYNTVLTVEGMYRKAINGVLIRDRNLRGPRMVNGQPYRDRDGRVLYADTILANGNIQADNQRFLPSMGEGIIDVTNQSEDYNYSISAQLNRRFSDAFEATVGYTYLQSKDVQSLTSDRAISNWRNGRQLATSHDDLTATTSYFERPHRIVAYGTYTLPWKLTDISLYYEGISGTPFTYVTNRDLNGDGYTGNDPIYVPRDATDPNEIRIGTGIGASFQQDMAAAQAFEDFIEKQPCLDEQRGKIVERNSCRSPFQHRLDLSIRQSIPQIRGNQVSVQLDIFNFLNFLNKDWGLVKLPTLSPTFPDQRALIHQGRNPGPLNQSIPTYQFDNRLWQDGAGPFDATAISSNYQMQLTVRYAF